MVVDFKIGKAPGFSAVTVAWKGRWDEKRIRKEFEDLAAWAKERGLRTGRWYFMGDMSGRMRVAIETKSGARGAGRVRSRKFPATDVARVQFDPDELSPRVVYHGLGDFLRWQRREKEVKSVGTFREVYAGNPWTNARAWSTMCVEATIRR